MLSADRRDLPEGEQEGREDFEQSLESLLSRFFRISEDIVGEISKGRFAAFLNGRLTERVVWDKARTLSEALWFSADASERDGCTQGCVGVYLFHAGESTVSQAFRKAEYALEMAFQSTDQHFYLYPASEMSDSGQQFPLPAYSASVLMNYIDEGVRILHAAEKPEILYVSPGYYKRIGLTEENRTFSRIQIHPDDMPVLEACVRETAEKGSPQEGQYRVRGEDGAWILCRVRFLRVAADREVPVVLEVSHNITGLEQLKYQNDENREWIRYVAGQIDCQLWEADLKTHTFRLLYTKNMLSGRRSVYENFPESLIDSGRVHRDSAERFREFAERMYEGKPDDTENFMIQYRQTSCYGWASMSYHMLYDEEGRPEKAIGIKEDLSYRPGRQSRILRRRAMPADLYPDLYCYAQANLTQDAVESLQLEGKDQFRLIGYKTFTALIRHGVMRIFSSEDARRIQKKYNRTCLLKAFQEGRRWFFDRCQVVDSEGEILWISVGVNLCCDRETGDVCLFAYLCRETDRRKWGNRLSRGGRSLIRKRASVKRGQENRLFIFSWKKTDSIPAGLCGFRSSAQRNCSGTGNRRSGIFLRRCMSSWELTV